MTDSKHYGKVAEVVDRLTASMDALDRRMDSTWSTPDPRGEVFGVEYLNKKTGQKSTEWYDSKFQQDMAYDLLSKSHAAVRKVEK